MLVIVLMTNDQKGYHDYGTNFVGSVFEDLSASAKTIICQVMTNHSHL